MSPSNVIQNSPETQTSGGSSSWPGTGDCRSLGNLLVMVRFFSKHWLHMAGRQMKRANNASPRRDPSAGICGLCRTTELCAYLIHITITWIFTLQPFPKRQVLGGVMNSELHHSTFWSSLCDPHLGLSENRVDQKLAYHHFQTNPFLS